MRKHGNKEIWKIGNQDLWKHGNQEIWNHENMETLKRIFETPQNDQILLGLNIFWILGLKNRIIVFYESLGKYTC